MSSRIVAGPNRFIDGPPRVLPAGMTPRRRSMEKRTATVGVRLSSVPWTTWRLPTAAGGHSLRMAHTHTATTSPTTTRRVGGRRRSVAATAWRVSFCYPPPDLMFFLFDLRARGLDTWSGAVFSRIRLFCNRYYRHFPHLASLTYSYTDPAILDLRTTLFCFHGTALGDGAPHALR